MDLSILLVAKKLRLLNRYVLFCLKSVDTQTYFENGNKNMSFVIKDDDVLDKYK